MPTSKKTLSRKQAKSDAEFLGYGEPLRAIVQLRTRDSVRARMARAFFAKQMFVFFGEMSSGQTGWGVDYNSWLAMRGWQLIDYRTYERVPSFDDELKDNGHDA